MLISRKLLAHIRYPEDWRERKKEILARDGFACRSCGGRHMELHVHHVVPLARGGSNKASNLISLSRRCHADRHGHMRFARWSRENGAASYALWTGFALLSVLLLVFLAHK